KAKVVNEIFCDGLGVCIGHCPQDALTITEKDVANFDKAAVETHLKKKPTENKYNIPCGCPGTKIQDLRKDKQSQTSTKNTNTTDLQNQLQQWPIQLHLVNPSAPYFQSCNLLIAASCTAFSYGNFHNDFIKNHIVAIACPKLDRTDGYIEKISEIIKKGDINSITVARMEVPCCHGLTKLVEDAIKLSGKKTPFLEQIISIKGNIL
ncbi:ferredoxin, partial [bacterium]|nr:ferredoxin [bacterium]